MRQLAVLSLIGHLPAGKWQKPAKMVMRGRRKGKMTSKWSCVAGARAN
jgi:hypothetical protein